MSKDILGQFGPDRHIASHHGMGGIESSKDVNNYQPPKGPRNITETKSPGLHGNNFDYCGSQEQASLKSESSGKPGLGGKTDCCVQGRH